MNFHQVTGPQINIMNKTFMPNDPALPAWYKANIDENDVEESLRRTKDIAVQTERKQSFPVAGKSVTSLVQNFLTASCSFASSPENVRQEQQMLLEIAQSVASEIAVAAGTPTRAIHHVFVTRLLDPSKIALVEFKITDGVQGWMSWFTSFFANTQIIAMHSWIFNFEEKQPSA